MSFADNLQYLRKKNKITQEELAEDLGVSRQSVSKWETGDAYPETEKLIALCDKFDVTLDDLLRGNVVEEDDEESEENETSEEEEGADYSQSGDGAKPFKSGGGCCGCGEGHNQPSMLAQRLSALTMFVCAITYVCLGITLNLWHPAWLIFLGGIVVCIWTGSLTDGRKTVKERVGGAVCGSTMIIAVIAYLAVGFTLKIWHPTWAIFIVAVGICAVVGTLMTKNK